MKKVTSLFLILICCLSMSIPAFATGTGPSDESFPIDSDGSMIEPIFVDEQECNVTGEEIWEFMDENIEPYDISSSAGIAEISAYPLLQDLDTGRLFYYPNIGRKVTFNSISQYNDIELTSTQAFSLYNEAISFLSANNPEPTHSYAVVGWWINTLVQLRAQNPQYLKWRVAEPNFGQGTDYSELNVPNSFISARLQGACAFPENASDTDRYRIKGIEGLFYYKTNAGQVFGIPFGAGISLNV